jgi:hypothetical protein
MASRPSLLRSAEPGLSGFVVGWLVISGLICIIDATFVLLRPLTLPGGKLAIFPWIGWHTYIQYDERYGAAGLTDSWVILQSWLNIAEIALQFLCVYLNSNASGCSKRVVHALAAVVSICTAYKTIIYAGMEMTGGTPRFVHVEKIGVSGVAFVAGLSLPWIVIPVYGAYQSLSVLIGNANSGDSAAAAEPAVHKTASKKK